MNIVSQMIVKKQQEFESKLQQIASNVQNSIFQQKLSSQEDSYEEATIVADTEAIDNSSTTNKITTLTEVDDQVSNIISKLTQQSQNSKLENVSEKQPSNSGNDTWGIMSRYQISDINKANETKYVGIISEMSEKYGVPMELVQKIIETESNYKNNALSSAGAQGLMQLMPATAKGLGVTNSYDPEQNIEAGVKLLSQHLKTYDGDLVLALAAYNAGPGNVRKYNGVPPFRETIQYIKKITGIDVSVSYSV